VLTTRRLTRVEKLIVASGMLVWLWVVWVV
jgi:hypothetical protein